MEGKKRKKISTFLAMLLLTTCTEQKKSIRVFKVSDVVTSPKIRNRFSAENSGLTYGDFVKTDSHDKMSIKDGFKAIKPGASAANLSNNTSRIQLRTGYDNKYKRRSLLSVPKPIDDPSPLNLLNDRIPFPIDPSDDSTPNPIDPSDYPTSNLINPSDDTTNENDFHYGVFTKDICSSFGSCSYQLKAKESLRYCHCDDECYKYNDCCFDANKTSTNIKGQNLPFKCVSPNLDGRSHYGYFIITQCPTEFDTSPKIIEMCNNRDLATTGPWVISNENVIYKNMFCAECNGVRSFISFSVNVSNINSEMFLTIPENETSIDNLVMKNSAQIVIDMVPPENVYTRRCLVYEPPLKELKEKCLSYSISACIANDMQYIYILKNVFCDYANYFEHCFDPIVQEEESQIKVNVYPLSFMFSFRNNSECGEQVIYHTCSLMGMYKLKKPVNP